MEEKVDKLNLIHSRKEALEHAQNGVLRPLGKQFGLNAFVWKCPQVEEVVAFLKGVPFKIVVVAPRVVVDTLVNDAKLIGRHCQWLAYDEGSREQVGNVDSIKPAVKWLRENEWQMEAFLFVADGVNADDSYLTFLKEWKEIK